MPRLALLFVLALPASAGPPFSVDAIPPVERPSEHFYGAIRDKQPVRVRWELSPASVPLGGSLTLILVVTNAANPHELTRPPLLDLDGFRELFTAAEDLPDEPGADVRFGYKLTPRNVGVLTVPTLSYSSYWPRAPEGSRTETTYTQSVRVTVTPAAETTVETVPVAGDESLFALRGGFSKSGGPNVWWWAVLLASSATLGVVWVVGWRVLFPDAARLARIRRNKAVRTALDRLKGSQSAEQIGVTVRNYFISRWGVAYTAQTPAEVAAGLLAAGVPIARKAEAEGLLREIDAARFGGSVTAVSAERAAELVRRWEGVP